MALSSLHLKSPPFYALSNSPFLPLPSPYQPSLPSNSSPPIPYLTILASLTLSTPFPGPSHRIPFLPLGPISPCKIKIHIIIEIDQKPLPLTEPDSLILTSMNISLVTTHLISDIFLCFNSYDFSCYLQNVYARLRADKHFREIALL